MRALCGAIIVAAAMIGLGLTELGYGIRYAGMGAADNPNTHFPWGATSMMIDQVILWCVALIGLGIAFVGLAYHHYHRHQELERLHGTATAGTFTTPPRTTV